MPSCLASSQGLLASTYSFTRSAKAMVSRMALPYSRSLSSVATCGTPACSWLSSAVPSAEGVPNWPPKRLAIKPAAREAMLMNLPTKSLLTRAIKSSGLKSTSSFLAVSLAAK